MKTIMFIAALVLVSSILSSKSEAGLSGGGDTSVQDHYDRWAKVDAAYPNALANY